MVQIHEDTVLYALSFYKAVNVSIQNMANREALDHPNVGPQFQTSNSEIQNALKTMSFSIGLLPKFIWQQNLT